MRANEVAATRDKKMTLAELLAWAKKEFKEVTVNGRKA